MELRYYINSTQIAEPIGFDDFKTKLKRTRQHGVSAESSVGQLEFDGVGFGMIQTAYNTDIDTELIFKAEIKCNDLSDWSELYIGILDLSTYEENYSDYCSCFVSVGEIGVKTKFNNRIETIVNVNDFGGDVDIDGNVIDYFAASQFMIMPVKKIYRTNSATSNGDVYNKDWTGQTSDNLKYPTGTELIKEHEGYIGQDEWEQFNFFTNPSSSTETFKITAKISFSISNTTSFGAPGIVNFLDDVSLDFTHNNVGGGTYAQRYNLASQINTSSHVSNFEIDVEFDFALQAGKTLSLYLYSKYKNYAGLGYRINWLSENHDLRILKEEQSNSSQITPFLAHETISKITQYISGLTVKSDYYGRFNSAINPLNEGIVGDGAMKCFVAGKGIRNRYAAIDLSFKYIIDNLIKIDNIGWGFSVENDTLFIRVEKWNWFYNDNVLLTIDNPANKKRTLQPEKVYSRLQSGYKKTITVDEINAVDGFHSVLNHSSLLKSIDNQLESVSDIIADPFAIELTRRAGIDLTTKDWKYDDSIFVIALKMDEYGTISVEQGAENADQTFLSPETMTNVRLSPARNALRFIDMLSNNIQKSDFKFTSGQGNFSAVCSPITEIGYYYLTDNVGGTITENSDITNITGLLKPELITFEYPITKSEFDDIKADPYGKITVDGEDCYIDEIIRDVMTGVCEFKLIPKI